MGTSSTEASKSEIFAVESVLALDRLAKSVRAVLTGLHSASATS